MLQRRIFANIAEDLTNKMVILSGPRQCGKTTLAKRLLVKQTGTYLNWDAAPDRLAIQKRQLNLDSNLWVFDELHKYKRWRAFLKDIADTYNEKISILVTGSARLELFGRGGDSLQGRYFPHRLHPITYSEFCGLPFAEINTLPELPVAPPQQKLNDLIILGGFPEPLFSGSSRTAARWRLAYAQRILYEEISSLSQVREIERMELLYDRLSDIAGSIVSINSLREDLEVAFETVRSWLTILERLDAIFRISPYGPPKIKSVKKEQKLYFYDWSRCPNEGARFENLIATHLWRAIDWAADVEGERLQLRYFRHREGHEVDFVLLKEHKPWIAIKAKLSDCELAPSLRYFVERVQPNYAFQVVLNAKNERRLPDIGRTKVRIVSATRFLANLP
ncbi:MAG: ATP-binding protein [Deltaproteobacteria bacterium]|nr:ATP-binding protein [Deltaproteobacteria bacterium]